MKAIQVRMARAAVGWGVRELAERAGVTANTISRIEMGADAKASTLEAIRSAFQSAGVTFLADGEASLSGGLGVRLNANGGSEAAED